MNSLSFMSANFVARQLNYSMSEGWGQGDRATNDYFRPLVTFHQRFGGLLQEIKALGFSTLDIWLAHLHPQWATPQHVAAARRLLEQYQMTVTSLAGGFGDTPLQFEESCRLAVQLGAQILGGNSSMLHQDRPFVLKMLAKYGLQLGIENHPEKSPRELLQKIGDGDESLIGVTLDTGWFGTHGYNAAQAIEELAPRLVHVHLKDVLAPGGHETCRLGQGCVPIGDCLEVLDRIGYRGAISIEHEPAYYDPSEDCRAGLIMVRQWLSGGDVYHGA